MSADITAKDIIERDLDTIVDSLQREFQELKGKRILITGGAGFLGYYLVQTVLHFNKRQDSNGDKAEVILYDNFIRGMPEWLRDIEDDPQLTLEKVDIIQPINEKLGSIDFIIHAASIASPIYYRKHPIETMDANVIGLRNMLEYCLKQREQGKEQDVKLLYFSTSEIYGDPDPKFIPTPEDYRGNVSCTGPRACYDESKRYGETMCVAFAQAHGLPIKTARPFNNYGPGLKLTDRRVIPDFVRNILNGEDIVMLSDGKPTRTFCYITDAITGYFKILFRGQAGDAYNIGTETPEISMAELAELIVKTGRELFGYQGKVVYQNSDDMDYLTDNPNRRCPIIKKAREHLDYDPKIGIEQGIRNSLIWYKDNQIAAEA